VAERNRTVAVGAVPGLVRHVLPVVGEDQELPVFALEVVEVMGRQHGDG
jgi:hypothetical protein